METSTLDMEMTDFRLLGELVIQVPWKTLFDGVGGPSVLVTFQETSQSIGKGNSKMLEVKQAGQKASLAEQGSSSRAQAEKESVWLLEARLGDTGRLLLTSAGRNVVIAQLELKLANTVGNNKNIVLIC